MKYVAIDIETTGVDPEVHQILEVGAILEDTNNILNYEDIPKFSCIIDRTELFGNVFALDMNKRIIEILKNYSVFPKEGYIAPGTEHYIMKQKYNIIKEKELAFKFTQWLGPHIQAEEDSMGFYTCPPFNVAGKNFASFDARFLNKVPEWRAVVRYERRIIDPSTSYTNWMTDVRLPSLDECLVRAGVDKVVSHTAVEDCWDLIQVLRKKYNQ